MTTSTATPSLPRIATRGAAGSCGHARDIRAVAMPPTPTRPCRRSSAQQTATMYAHLVVLWLPRGGFAGLRMAAWRFP
jgi:hypothetical protein